MDESLKNAGEAFEREEKLFMEAQENYEQALHDSLDEDKNNSLTNVEMAYQAALARYEKARINYIPFWAEQKIPVPPLVRAAYSDRMAWILAIMAKVAYIRFDKAKNPGWEDELGRLKFCLQSSKYESEKEMRHSLKHELAFELVDVFDTSEGYQKGTMKTDTQAFLAMNDSFAVLAFRGTQPATWSDIQTDLRLARRRTEEGKVHTGFMVAFDEVKDQIKRSLPKIGARPLYITGHSLGAALATVAAREFEHLYEDQIAACYTFGSPLVGDGVYEKSIKVPFYRLVNPTDVVTLIPRFFGAYMHVGDVRYLSRKPDLYRGLPIFFRAWEATLEMLVAAFHLSNPFSPWIGQHEMNVYIKKLETIAIARQNLQAPDEMLKPGGLWK